MSLTVYDLGAGYTTGNAFGCFGSSCSPTSLGAETMATTCGAGNAGTYTEIRYYAEDDIGNQQSPITNATNSVRVDRKIPYDGTFTVTPGNGQNTLDWSGFSDSGSGLDITDTYKIV